MEGVLLMLKRMKNQLMNVKNNNVSPSSLHGSLRSRNLLPKKDGRCLAVLSSGKCLKIFKNSSKVSRSDEFSTYSPSHFLGKLGADYNADQSRKVISLPSNTSSSPSTDVYQGTLQFTTRADGMPRFVFKLDNQEDDGGWGLKLLKKSSLVKTESGSSLTSLEVVIPSGRHGGPEDGPWSLIERWKSQGNCDCGGWDLGCYLTLLKGQTRKDNHLELLIEGSKHETTELRI